AGPWVGRLDEPNGNSGSRRGSGRVAEEPRVGGRGVDAEPRVEQPLLPALAVEREEDRLVGGVRNPLVADRLVDLHLGRRVLGAALATPEVALLGGREDRKSTRLNSSHVKIS